MNRILTRLQQAIAAYPPDVDEHGSAVIARFASGSRDGARRVARAFDNITKNQSEALALLRTCIDAEVNYRTLRERVALLHRDQDLLENLKNSADLLRKHVLGDLRIDTFPKDPLAAYVVFSPLDVSSAKQGLYVIESAIEIRQRIARQTFVRLGITRKTAADEAAEAAAMFWICEGVQQVSGKPHWQDAALLAGTTLDKDIDDRRVRSAWRARSDNNWRDA